MRTNNAGSVTELSTRTPVVIDDDLVWLVPSREADPARSRPASITSLHELRDTFLDELTEAQGSLTEALIDAAARVVAACLADLPELPFIGEPFGGREGSD